MMYSELYRYFILHKELPLPGIGTFQLQTQPAKYDFPEKIFRPPVYSVLFQHGNGSAPRRLFEWLADVFSVSERDAVIRFNDFVFEMKQLLQQGNHIPWNGMGELQADEQGNILFVPAEKEFSLEEPVAAEKIIRKDAVHSLRVGEEERTSEEMNVILQHTEPKTAAWWAWPLIIALLAVIFTGWYFSTYGLDTSSTGNRQIITPKEVSAVQQELR